MRGTTFHILYPGKRYVYFNSRAPCGARLASQTFCAISYSISTHVPHAGHDQIVKTVYAIKTNFNSRAPCGARQMIPPPRVSCPIFQLTCPMRGTTRMTGTPFSTLNISTHVPHAGHDVFNAYCPAATPPFQLTCPMRGTTPIIPKPFAVLKISTHVPHAGHD